VTTLHRINAPQNTRRRSFMAQPTKHPTTGIYQLRRKVPADLVAALGREYKRSLGTRDPEEAKRRHASQWLIADELFANARNQVTTGAHLADRDIVQLASHWLRTQVDAMEEANTFEDWLAPDSALVQAGDDMDEVPVFTTLRIFNDGDDDDPGLDKVVSKAIRSTLKSFGVVAPKPGTSADQKLRLAFRERVFEVSDLAFARHQGNWKLQPEVVPAQPLFAKAQPIAVNDGGLMGLFEGYAKDKRLNDGNTPRVMKTLASYKAMCAQFVDYFNDPPLSGITRQMIAEYRDVLVQLPAKGEGLRNLSVRQQIDRAKKDNLPTAMPATVRNKLRAISAVLGYGVRIASLTENPVLASGIGAAAAKAAVGRAVRRRKSYTREELNLIFSSQLFSEPSDVLSRRDLGEAMYWMPLLMYYTGARREELAQLNVRDVKHSPQLVPYFSILATVEDDDEGRRVKNEGSRRVIPLHPDLVELGFFAYVDKLPNSGQLFPLLKPNRAGFRGESFGKKWRAYLLDVVGLQSPAHPSHGFRHTFKTMCRDVGIPEDASDAIMGHAAAAGEGRRYGEWGIPRLYEEMRKIPRAPTADLLPPEIQSL
jgi:integrase